MQPSRGAAAGGRDPPPVGTGAPDPAPTSDARARQAGDGVLTQAELDYFVDAAIARWAEAGLTDGQLAALRGDELHASPTWPASISARSRRARSRSIATPPARAGSSTPRRSTIPSSATRSPRRWLQTDPTGAPAGPLRPAHHHHARDGPRARPRGQLPPGDRGDLMYG